jgi:hypothetical protein
MPFNPDSPFTGPNGLPNLKAYAKSWLTWMNKWIKPTGDGDPPSDMYGGPGDFWLKSALQPTLDSLAIQPTRTFEFFFRGDVEASSGAQQVSDDWHCQYALAWPETAGTTSAVTMNFEYQGDTVLSSNLSIPAGSTGTVYSVAFDVPDLVAGALELDRRLVGRCVASDSGDTAQNVHLALVCTRIAP